MQGDRQTLEDPRWSRSVIPLAHCVRPSPLKGGLTLWQAFEDPRLSRAVIPLAHCVRPSPLKGGPTLRRQTGDGGWVEDRPITSRANARANASSRQAS